MADPVIAYDIILCVTYNVTAGSLDLDTPSYAPLYHLLYVATGNKDNIKLSSHKL